MKRLSGAMALAAAALILGGGIIVMLASGRLAAWIRVHPALVALPAFIAYNVALAWSFGLAGELREFWSLRHPVIPCAGFLVGAVLGLCPTILALASGHAVTAQPLAVSLTGALLTLCTVCWEELWFRGIALNLMAARAAGPVGAAVFSGVAFAGIHVLNPSIRLVDAAPNLFLAAVLLAAGYFRFRSIYFPIGVHFAWNLLQRDIGPLLLGRKPPDYAPWGENGLVVTALLLVCAILLLRKARRDIQAPPVDHDQSDAEPIKDRGA